MHKEPLSPAEGAGIGRHPIIGQLPMKAATESLVPINNQLTGQGTKSHLQTGVACPAVLPISRAH